MGKRITLIHAMPVSIPPILEAFQEGWPEAEIGNLLDDGLTAALQREGGLTTGIVARICDLAAFATRNGANGILFTCSAFGPAINVARQLVSIPVLNPDEAMIAAALGAGTRVGVVVTLAAFAPASASQLHAAAAARGGAVEVHTSVAAGALAALNVGDPAAHDRLVAEAAEVLAGRVDVICLDQFSMARARATVQARVTAPVLTGPATAVARLKALLNA